MRRFELIVFDWDGTLVDSAEHIVTGIQAACRALGWPAHPAHGIREIIGLAWPVACERLFPQFSRAEHEQLKAHYLQHMTQQSTMPPQPFPGVREVLQQLAGQDYLLAVATGKGRDGLRRSLRETGLGGVLAASRCGDEAASKPDPQMLRDIMAELDVSPERTLMVGDTEFDLRMAQAAGTAAVGVGYGAHEPERLQRYAPLACIDDIRRLPALL